MATFNALAAPAVNQQWTKDIAQVVKDNFDFFRTPPKALYAPSVAASAITTSSSTFVDLTGFSITFTTQGGVVVVGFAGRGQASVANVIRFDLLLDGVSVTGDNDGVGALSSGAANLPTEFAVWRWLAPAAGSRTIKVQWRTTSGIGTISPAGLCQLAAWEVWL